MPQSADDTLRQLEERIAQLETRLAQAEDVQAIHRLKARYGAVTDRRYGKKGSVPADRMQSLAREVAELFTEEGVWDGGKQLGKCVGREAIYERFLEPTLEFAWHFFVKPQIQVDGEVAHGSWDILAPCTGFDGKAYWMAGVEHDRYQKVEGRWLHSYMTLDVAFMCPYERGWAQKAAAAPASKG